MHIGGESAIVSGRTERIIQQGVDMQWKRHVIGLVSHLGGGLININHSAIAGGKTHRHARAGEKPWKVIQPKSRVIIIVCVQANAVVQLDLRLA